MIVVEIEKNESAKVVDVFDGADRVVLEIEQTQLVLRLQRRTRRKAAPQTQFSSNTVTH